MPDTPPEPLAATLRRAGFDLPDEAVADLARGHDLLLAMLQRLGATGAEAEPATIFRPETAR
jgi:hypothetical protein